MGSCDSCEAEAGPRPRAALCNPDASSVDLLSPAIAGRIADRNALRSRARNSKPTEVGANAAGRRAQPTRSFLNPKAVIFRRSHPWEKRLIFVSPYVRAR